MLSKFTDLIALGNYISSLPLTELVIVHATPNRWWEVDNPVFLVQHDAPFVPNWKGSQFPAICAQTQAGVFVRTIYPDLLKRKECLS